MAKMLERSMMEAQPVVLRPSVSKAKDTHDNLSRADVELPRAVESPFSESVLAPIRALGIIPRWVWLSAILLVAGSFTSFGTAADVPEQMLVGPGIRKAIDGAVDWVVVYCHPFFSAVNTNLLKYLLVPLQDWLIGLPWWLTTFVVSLAAYRVVGRSFGFLAAGMMVALAAIGLFEAAMATLSIVLTATLLAIVLGVPAGIIAAKNDLFDAAIRPVLDLMQTMPSFVYLIPVVMLFGLGKVPAVIAVWIYAVPPIIRFTNLGIRQVDANVLEAARAFGATGAQLLIKVQLPLALPTIMAGLNQTIMMALAMVVIAAMIGAGGVGAEVLNGIARLESGTGLLGGIAIVFMAMILDRITQGLVKQQPVGRG
ncbi:MAG: ABC transporter permease [Chloroflexota bacterium]|jgi:glycine betaine/proline transport system permease protein